MSTARAVLVVMALRDVESAKRVRDEIRSKVAFALPRHLGIDVRGLLQQDLLLLHALCLSTGSSATVAACWRLHVGLLLDILRRTPAAADSSLAMVKHVVLPCLNTLAALCLDGVDYPAFQEERGGPRAASRPSEEPAQASDRRVEDVVLD
ncbi:unnamed protein product, partial [Hapterophycus canaliculatus]